ncbi:hypothetical protein [Endozoicomonas ascidiicola]|uniref:hypothetical protein n=1 Tax=Endozoicomonas ascidiicola TaxID=1698521 RepID=UPI00082D30B0|nr:hypothetical protein [Endozoicomonas ascidiicola]
MTEAQYMWGWITYLVGATGCLISLWFIVRRWWPRLRRIVMLVATALVYVPWYVNTDEHFLAPAAVISLYDGLGIGVDTMWRSGQIAAIAAGIAIIVALILPVKKTSSAPKKGDKSPKSGNKTSHKQRTEPSI